MHAKLRNLWNDRRSDRGLSRIILCSYLKESSVEEGALMIKNGVGRK